MYVFLTLILMICVSFGIQLFDLKTKLKREFKLVGKLYLQIYSNEEWRQIISQRRIKKVCGIIIMAAMMSHGRKNIGVKNAGIFANMFINI